MEMEDKQLGDTLHDKFKKAAKSSLLSESNYGILNLSALINHEV